MYISEEKGGFGDKDGRWGGGKINSWNRGKNLKVMFQCNRNTEGVKEAS